MATTTLKHVELHGGEFIPFVPINKRFGRAEFVLCPIYKYGKLDELFIFRKQQQNVTEYYHWKATHRMNRSLSFQGYEGLEDPKVWNVFYCKEHKTQSIELYVPNEANYLWFEVYTFQISIGFTKRNFKS